MYLDIFKNFDKCRGYNKFDGMVYGFYIPGYAIFNLFPKYMFYECRANSAFLGTAYIHKDLDYIVKQDPFDPFSLKEPVYDLVTDKVDYAKIFYPVLSTSVSTPIGMKSSYVGYMKGNEKDKQLLFDGDIVSPKNIQVGVIGVVKKRVKATGSPAVVQIRPDSSFDTWPNYVNIEDFEWDIMGNIWETPELLCGWDGFTEKYDPFSLDDLSV